MEQECNSFSLESRKTNPLQNSVNCTSTIDPWNPNRYTIEKHWPKFNVFSLQTEHKFRDRADYKSDLHLRKVPKGNLIDQSNQ